MDRYLSCVSRLEQVNNLEDLKNATRDIRWEHIGRLTDQQRESIKGLIIHKEFHLRITE